MGQASLIAQGEQVCSWINQHNRYLTMADDILLGRTKQPIIQAILAAGSEENQKPPSISPLKGGGQNRKFFVNMETVAFGDTLLVGDSLSCAFCNGLDMRDDTLGVAFGLAAVVVRAQ